MANYSPHEFLYARPLANAILTNQSVRRWLLSGTRFANFGDTLRPIPELQARLRTTADARRWFWFNHYCTKDRRCSCKVGTGLETDILIILEADNAFRLAIHVEVKPPNESLGPGQAETYPLRASCWASIETRPRTVLAHNDSVTILACGDNLKSDHRLSCFDKVVFHHDIEKHIQPYPDVIDLRRT